MNKSISKPDAAGALGVVLRLKIDATRNTPQTAQVLQHCCTTPLQHLATGEQATMRRKPTMVHAKPTAQGRTAARKTGTEGTGPGTDKGDATDAILPRFRLVLINALPGRVER